MTPSSPKSNASGARVIAFYLAHRSTERVSVIIGVFATAFLVFFAASVRDYLRRTPAAVGLSALVLPAATLFAAGFTISAGFAYALADVPSRLDPAAAQTLNLLDEDVFFTVFVGVGVFGLATGLAILRGARLPTWLGWVAIVIGLAAFTPAIGLALLALTVWVFAVSILITCEPDDPRPHRRSSSCCLNGK
jgi:hypothetical protein